MSSQKIPLFDGVMKPVGEPTGLVQVPLFTPPDKNLKDGTQAFYEVHMWVAPAAATDTIYTILATQDGDPAGAQAAWTGHVPPLPPFAPGLPVKMLDGYPVRGDMTLSGGFKQPAGAPGSVHVYGYYYRVGQGEVLQSARRFIGQNLSPTFDAGLPIPFKPLEKKVIHTFEKGRIDELSLAFVRTAFGTAAFATLRFEDAAGVILPSTTPILIEVDNYPDSSRNPPSPYNFYQTPFGGSPNLPTLAQLSVEAGGVGSDEFAVHGYFTRH